MLRLLFLFFWGGEKMGNAWLARAMAVAARPRLARCMDAVGDQNLFFSSFRHGSSSCMPRLVLEGTDGITSLTVEQCPKLGWQPLLARCRGVKTLRIVADTAGGDGSELLQLISDGVGGIDDQGAAVGNPVVQTAYSLTLLREDTEVAAMEEGITGLAIVIALEAYIRFVDDELTCGETGSAPEVDTVTLDNIGEHLQYFNGETYEEYLAQYAKDNMDINELIKQ